jgi:hypothetical protein
MTDTKGCLIFSELETLKFLNLFHNKYHVLPYFWSQLLLTTHTFPGQQISRQLNKIATIQTTQQTICGTSKLFNAYNLYD